MNINDCPHAAPFRYCEVCKVSPCPLGLNASVSGNVVNLPVVTSIDIPPERVLRGALFNDLESVVVIGYDKSGEEYFASSIAGGPETLWLIERCKLKLLKIAGK